MLSSLSSGFFLLPIIYLFVAHTVEDHWDLVATPHKMEEAVIDCHNVIDQWLTHMKYPPKIYDTLI